jgi:hypothetical protein
MPIGLIFSYFMHLYANFQMCHFATFEISLQTFPSVP